MAIDEKNVAMRTMVFLLGLLGPACVFPEHIVRLDADTGATIYLARGLNAELGIGGVSIHAQITEGEETAVVGFTSTEGPFPFRCVRPLFRSGQHEFPYEQVWYGAPWTSSMSMGGRYVSTFTQTFFTRFTLESFAKMVKSQEVDVQICRKRFLLRRPVLDVLAGMMRDAREGKRPEPPRPEEPWDIE